MRIHVYSVHGDGLYLASDMVREGNEVFVFIEHPFYKTLYDGILNKYKTVEAWRGNIKKGEQVFFDANSEKNSKIADELRKTNPVFNGGSLAFMLEEDRAESIRFLDKFGVNVPFTMAFDSKAKAISALKDYPNTRFVYKPSGDHASASTYVSDKTEDLIEHINAMPDNVQFILQEFVEGLEVCTTILFANGKPVSPSLHTVELKKLFPNRNKRGIGCNTGCMSSLEWADDNLDNKPVQDGLAHLFKRFEAERYSGEMDLSGFLEDGIFWASEFTPRCGYSATKAYMQFCKIGFAELITKCSTGNLTELPIHSDYWGMSIRYAVWPYPLEAGDKSLDNSVKKVFDDMVTGKKVKLEDQKGIEVSYVDIMKKDNELVMAGVHGILCEISCASKNIESGEKLLYNYADKIKVGEGFYRDDSFEMAKEMLPQLKKMDYFCNSKLTLTGL